MTRVELLIKTAFDEELMQSSRERYIGSRTNIARVKQTFIRASLEFLRAQKVARSSADSASEIQR